VFQFDKNVPMMNCNCFIYDHLGQPVAAFKSKIPSPLDKISPEKNRQFVLDIDEMLLLPGRYRVDVVILGDTHMQDSVQAATIIDVAEGKIGRRPAQADKRFSVTMPHRWTIPSKEA
jgi:lipopolysaccharide transport system ATP-binding protein